MFTKTVSTFALSNSAISVFIRSQGVLPGKYFVGLLGGVVSIRIRSRYETARQRADRGNYPND